MGHLGTSGRVPGWLSLLRHLPLGHGAQDMDADGRGEADIAARLVDGRGQVIDAVAALRGKGAESIPEFGFQRHRCAVAVQGQRVFFRAFHIHLVPNLSEKICKFLRGNLAPAICQCKIRTASCLQNITTLPAFSMAR